ncbi:MAG: restriction endonuclease subunit S [Marinobacter sp.]|uniref:restriction endonuclease subunit S n=1 Tax=Marinobacter sp. TaxID=50741 RepID=UPI003298B2B1
MSRNFSSFDEVLESKPGDWKVERLGNLFAQRKEKNRPDLPLLAVTGTGGVVPRDSLERRDTSNADKSKYLRVCEGDIAYNTMRMWQGVSGLSSYEGIVSPAYTICRPKDGVSSTYMAQLFKLPELIQIFHRNSQGLVDDTLNLKFENFSPIQVPVPPFPEQQKIAAILSSVDDVIEKTRAQIDKLKDLKTGMMQELLTKGIGSGGVPHTEFRDSPVGRIPASWNILPLEQLVRPDRKITYGIVQAGPHHEEGVPYIRVSDMTRRHLSLDGMLRTSPEIAQKYKRSSVSAGDIVYALRGVIGHVHLVPAELEGANLTQGTARLSPNDRVHSRYLLWAMKSPAVQLQNDLEAKGSTFKEVTLASLRKIQITLPPPEEQVQIASVMDCIERKLHGAEDKFEHLQRLKKALMQDLLTGKVRVKVDQKESAVA